MNKLLILLGLTLLAQACYKSPAPNDSIVGAASSEKWATLLNNSDIDGLADLYTKDTRVLPPNGSIKVGRTAVREEFGAMINAGMKMDLTSIESKVSGDIAFNVGTYELRVGDQVIDNGKWIETWQLEDDGSWRISNDIWNSDNPPMPETKKAMTHMIGIHKVRDAAIWLQAWRGQDGRRKDFAANGAPHVHVMQSQDDPNLTGLVIGLEDPGAFVAWLNSDEGKAAATADTVDMDSITLLNEVE